MIHVVTLGMSMVDLLVTLGVEMDLGLLDMGINPHDLSGRGEAVPVIAQLGSSAVLICQFLAMFSWSIGKAILRSRARVSTAVRNRRWPDRSDVGNRQPPRCSWNPHCRNTREIAVVHSNPFVYR
jgi:hypothetical protein